MKMSGPARPTGAPLVFASLVLGAAGCGGDARLEDYSAATVPNDAAFDSAQSIRLDVRPGLLLDGGLSQGLRALPQTLQLDDVSGSVIDVPELLLLEPVRQAGTITGYSVNPQISLLPGTSAAVEGTVFLRKPNTVQTYAASTDPQGDFEAWLVPQDTYQLTVVPDDPQLPMHTQELTVDGSPDDVNVDVGYGAPVYGAVRSSNGPVYNARVHLVDELGNRSASALTDEHGRYQIRVQPGTYTLVCEGREVGQDPTLRQAEIEVPIEGALVDFAYPSDLPQALAEGRIISPTGQNLAGTVVRFLSEELDGYGDLDASWSWDAPIQGPGTFIAKVVPGLYTIEVLPPDVRTSAEDPGGSPGLSPVRQTGVRLGLEATLDDIEILRTLEVTGTLSTEQGEPLAGGTVQCTEVGFDERSWFANTNDEGTFQLHLPQIPLDCLVGPPGDRRDLAQGTIRFDPREQTSPQFTLGTGALFQGSVRGPEGEGEPFASIELRDLQDRLLAFGVTDEDGSFSIRAELSDADAP